ncbi:helix-turn-helix transcriptional regulator [Nanoarchaeota archaeon]
MRQVCIFALLLLLCSAFGYGAEITGVVYDFSLNRIDNAIVEINTVPAQRIVAENGEYSFNAKRGSYNVKASYYVNNDLVSSTEQAVVIVEEGVFNIDLVLFPNVDEAIKLAEMDVEMPDANLQDSEIKPYVTVIALTFISLIVLIFLIIYFFVKKKRKSAVQPENLSELPKKILQFIKAQEGRTTQKDIRKQFPLSEAKISLIIAELEHNGKIKKIKKGRGNIIVLK